jgi:hypothetical protein
MTIVSYKIIFKNAAFFQNVAKEVLHYTMFAVTAVRASNLTNAVNRFAYNSDILLIDLLIYLDFVRTFMANSCI